MKRKVRLTHTIELYVEGKSEEAIYNWLLQTTPEEAYHLATGGVEEHYSEEIVCAVNDNTKVNYVIKEEE